MQRGLRPRITKIIKGIKSIRKNGISAPRAELTSVARAVASERIVERLALRPKRTSLAPHPAEQQAGGPELRLQARQMGPEQAAATALNCTESARRQSCGPANKNRANGAIGARDLAVSTVTDSSSSAE